MSTAAEPTVKKMQLPAKATSRKSVPPEPAGVKKPISLFATKPSSEHIMDGKNGKETKGKEIDFFKALVIEPIPLEKKVDKEKDPDREYIRDLKKRLGEDSADEGILEALCG